jgi:hypothetical protein
MNKMSLTLNTLKEFDKYSVSHLKEQLQTTYTPRTLFTTYETIMPFKKQFPKIYQALNEVLQ